MTVNKQMSDNPYNASQIIKVLSIPRMLPYQRVADSDADALDLYSWAVQISSACFEIIAHFEVAFRNALDAQLRLSFEDHGGDIPWLFCSPPTNEIMQTNILTTRDRLPKHQKNYRDQITSNLSFGFWSGLLGTKHEDLWRQTLHRAFPNAPKGTRKEVAIKVEGIRKFRNRLAHHDSILNADILFELRRIFKVAQYIDPQLEQWLRSIDRATNLYKEKPIKPKDTVVVAARLAWPLYEKTNAYVCQPDRSFQDVDYVAFYSDKQIQPEIGYIKYKEDNVDWSEENAHRLLANTDPHKKKIGRIILASREAGWAGGMYQVFLLTNPQEIAPHGKHKTLENPIPHLKQGAGSAFTMGQRYVSLVDLESATTTADL